MHQLVSPGVSDGTTASHQLSPSVFYDHQHPLTALLRQVAADKPVGGEGGGLVLGIIIILGVHTHTPLPPFQ